MRPTSPHSTAKTSHQRAASGWVILVARWFILLAHRIGKP